MLSKKHYKAIADILQKRLAIAPDIEGREIILETARDLAEYFKTDNPAFNYELFFNSIAER